MMLKFIEHLKTLIRRERGTQSPSARSSINDYLPNNISALNIATVYRCIKILSESVAALPFKTLRLKNGVFTDDEDSKLYYLLAVEPNPTQSAFNFIKEIVEQVYLYGNAYIIPIYNLLTVQPDRLVLCSKGSVSHDIYNNKYMITDTLNGINGTYNENEVIHIKIHSADGKSGQSVLTFARTTVNIAGASESETLKRFTNGGNVRGIISNDTSTVGFGRYQDKELENTALTIDERFQRGEHIVSLPGDVDFKQISLTPADMQFLESRRFTVRDICRFFGVHPSFVFDDTSNNYKSAEMANVAFLSNTLSPLLRNIESEFSRKLIAPTLFKKIKIEFDRQSLYACDLDSKVKYQTATIQAGIYTINDWRRKENQPIVQGGDNTLISANLKELNELNNKNNINKNG